MKRSGGSTWIYLFLVFASGIALGVFSDRIYTSKTVAAKANPAPRDPNEYRRKYTEEMRTRLKLDAEQVAKLTVFMEQTRARMREFHERTKPELAAIHDQQVARVESMLNPTQRLEYEKMLAERAAREAEKAKALK